MVEEVGNAWTEGVHPDDLQRCFHTYMSAFKARRPFRIEYRLRRADGEYRWILDSGAPRFSSDGGFAGFIGSALDITERHRAEDNMKAALREKEVLLREIHHRVKNNLQVISSLLNIQSSYIEDPKALALYKESQNRIRSMALLHAILYQSKDLAAIDFGEYVRRLTANLWRSYGVKSDSLNLSLHMDDVSLGLDTAIPCGLIINELVSNSIQHGFPNGHTGEIRVELQRKGAKEYALTIADSGVGLPNSLDFRNSESLGFQLVLTLTDQIGGVIDLFRNGGTSFRITFAEVEYRERLLAGAA